MENETFDVVVVGAGSAGAATAWQFASRGKRVALVEQKSLAEAGARWINGVAPWMFDRAGITRPEVPELRARDGAFLLYSKDGNHRVRVDSSPVWQVDMRRLIGRLQRLATDAGVVCFPQCKVNELVMAGDRLEAVVIRRKHARNAALRLDAKLFVDATGFVGALRRLVPRLHAECAPPGNTNMCTAAQEVRHLRDRAAASRWLASHGAQPGDSVGYVAVDGGFSSLVVQVDLAGGEVDLLTGSIADGTHRSGTELIADFTAKHAWIGRKVFGDSGVIPLRRPFARMTAPGIALVGDSACQVFPAHGSGVGTGLIAGALLSEALADRPDPGDAAALWAYQRAYMKEVGAVSAAYDVVRQVSQRFTDKEAIELIGSGLTTAAMTHATLGQQMARITKSDLPALLRAVRRAPQLAAKLAPSMVKMQAAYYLHKAYPGAPRGFFNQVWFRFNHHLFEKEFASAINEPLEDDTIQKAA